MNKTIKRPLDELSPHPLNEQIYSNLKPDQALLDSIQSHGLLEPIVVTPEGLIISGHRRSEACRQLGFVMVDTRQINDVGERLEEKLIEFNRQRIKTSLERVREIRHLQLLLGTKRGARSDLQETCANIDASSKRRPDTRTKVARALGISTGNISKLLFIDEVDASLLSSIDDGTISIHQAYLEARKRKNQQGLNEISSRHIVPVVSQSNCWEILVGDCRDVDLTGKKIQTIICSPPYWKMRDFGDDKQIGAERTSSHFISNLVEIFDTLRNCLADDGCLFVELGDQAMGNEYSGLLERFVISMLDDGWHLRERIIIEKQNWSSPRKKTWVPTYSLLYFFSKGANYRFNRDAIRRPYQASSTPKPQIYNKRNDGVIGTPSFPHPMGAPARNIMKANTEKWIGRLEKLTGIRASHPAIFSTDVVKEPILATTNEGEIVLDCFSGTGTTGVAAMHLNRKYIGIEVNSDYAKVSKLRLHHEQLSILENDKNKF